MGKHKSPFNPPSLELLTLTHARVRAYWNLHRKMYSIQARFVDEWRVVGYASELTLRYVTFKVSQAGRQRVLRTGVKNVHAYVLGALYPYVPELIKSRPVSYSPTYSDSFALRVGMDWFAVNELPSLTLTTENNKPVMYAPSGEYELANGFLVKKEEKECK
jgi:hypothetical protein